jgi:hypothetical protein
MLKLTYQTKNQELKTWVNPENGSLNVQIGEETVQVPYENGIELVSVLKQKQSSYKEVERKKHSPWNRFIEMASGNGKGFWSTSWSDI